eukprot:2636585-Rhodomonas_salina.2
MLKLACNCMNVCELGEEIHQLGEERHELGEEVAELTDSLLGQTISAGERFPGMRCSRFGQQIACESGAVILQLGEERHELGDDVAELTDSLSGQTISAWLMTREGVRITIRQGMDAA